MFDQRGQVVGKQSNHFNHEDLYQAALEAIKQLFGDQSVAKEETIKSLQSLQGEIEIMLESLG